MVMVNLHIQFTCVEVSMYASVAASLIKKMLVSALSKLNYCYHLRDIISPCHNSMSNPRCPS